MLLAIKKTTIRPTKQQHNKKKTKHKQQHIDVPTKNPLYSPSKTKESFFRDQFDKHKNTYIKVTIQIQKKT